MEIIQNRLFKSLTSDNRVYTDRIERRGNTYKIYFDKFSRLLRYNQEYMNFYFVFNNEKFYLMAV